MKAKYLLTGLIILVLIAGGAIGLYLVRQNQDTREQAAVQDGVASISLSPYSRSDLSVGDTFQVEVKFDTNSTAISQITAELSFADSGISISSVDPNQELINTDRFRYDLLSEDTNAGVTTVSVSATSTVPSGYTSTGEVALVTITMSVDEATTIEPAFAINTTKIYSKTTGEDILGFPAVPAGTYGTGGGGGTPSPTPSASPSPSPGASPSPSPSPSPTPDPIVGDQDGGGTGSGGNGGSAASLVILSPTNGASLTSTTPIISGAASGSTIVDVTISGTQTHSYSATSDADGSWSVTTDVLAGGNYTVTASANGETASVTFSIVTATGDVSLPTAGNASYTMAFLGMGFLLLLAGAGLLVL